MSIQELVFYELRDCALKVRNKNKTGFALLRGLTFGFMHFGCSRNRGCGEIMWAGY